MIMDGIEREKSLIDDINFIKIRDYSTEGLLAIYRKTNNPDILNIIIKRFEKLVYKVASEFKNKGVEFEDLLQLAFTGLIVAINRFDLERQNKFSTYAVYCIKGEISHYIRDSGLIKIPRWLQHLNKSFDNFVKEFKTENNRYPTKEEISLGINVSIDGIDEILKARQSVFYNLSLDENDEQLNDTLSYNKSLIKSRYYRSFELIIEDKILLWDAIDKLSSLHKRILISNYILGLSQSEIGKRIGISQKSVSRHLNEAIKKLRYYLIGNLKE